MSPCVDDRLVCRGICSCIPDGHLHRVTYTRCIDTNNSPDHGHIAVRNMWRVEISIHEKELCVKLVIYKDEIYGLLFFASLTQNTGTVRFFTVKPRSKRLVWLAKVTERRRKLTADEAYTEHRIYWKFSPLFYIPGSSLNVRSQLTLFFGDTGNFRSHVFSHFIDCVTVGSVNCFMAVRKQLANCPNPVKLSSHNYSASKRFPLEPSWISLTYSFLRIVLGISDTGIPQQTLENLGLISGWHDFRFDCTLQELCAIVMSIVTLHLNTNFRNV